MDYAKNWWESTTLQGAVINILVFIDLLFKLNIGGETINQLVVGILGVIGLIMVIYGRLKATSAIK
jgi:hypothetical protein